MTHINTPSSYMGFLCILQKNISVMRLFVLCLALFLASPLPLAGAENERTEAVLDGLGGRTGLLSTRCIAQDSRGMIWFGTTRGLYSYDGFEISNYHSVGPVPVNSLAIVDTLIYRQQRRTRHIRCVGRRFQQNGVF